MNPFDCGYLRLDVICVNSHSIAKLWNSFDTKYLALSIYRHSGIPCTAKIAFKYSIQLVLMTLFIVFTNVVLFWYSSLPIEWLSPFLHCSVFLCCHSCFGGTFFYKSCTVLYFRLPQCPLSFLFYILFFLHPCSLYWQISLLCCHHSLYLWCVT